MRKAARSVTLQDMLEIVSDRKADQILSATLKGHLALEALLMELIELKSQDTKIWKWSFPQKTQFLFDEDIISTSLKEALDKVNDFRNDYAHIFGHESDVPSVLNLAKNLAAGGVEFTDNFESLPQETAVAWYGDELGLLAEIFKHLLLDTASILEEIGGRDLLSAS